MRARLLVGFSAALAACSSTAPAAQTPDKPPIVLPETVITKTDPAALPALFQAASDKLLHDDFKAAAEGFEHVLAVAPNGETAESALYEAGIAYLGLNQRDKALERFERVVDGYPTSDTTLNALLRITRILSWEEKWPELEKAADKILALKGLSVIDTIEAMGAKGLSLVSQGKVDEAFDVIAKARNLVEDNHLGEAGQPPVELAQVSFGLGEVRRIKSERIVFDPFPANFGAALEERCTGLLDAQDAYTDAMRAKDAHWSAMSGYRIGEMYAALHTDVMKTPVPPAKSLKLQELYEGALRLRYRILLEKGLTMIDHTVALADRTGEDSEWVHRARDAQKALQLALADEKAALAKLPYSEAELRQALDDLKKGKK